MCNTNGVCAPIVKHSDGMNSYCEIIKGIGKQPERWTGLFTLPSQCWPCPRRTAPKSSNSLPLGRTFLLQTGPL